MTDDLGQLPPYLHRTEPMEIDDLPLQVALLTMEIAAMRATLAKLNEEMGIEAPPPPSNQDLVDAFTGIGTEELIAYPVSRDETIKSTLMDYGTKY